MRLFSGHLGRNLGLVYTCNPPDGQPTAVTEKTQTDYNITSNFKSYLKPTPDNIQDEYLKSLTALGIIPNEKTDEGFVEDNWESPTLGAWG